MADLRRLPKVDRLAASDVLKPFSPAIRAEAARTAVAQLRTQAVNGEGFDPAHAEALALDEARRLAGPNLRRVLNATGIVLHTGLGRARLAESAARQLAEVAAYHSNTELELESGLRGDRQAHVREALVKLTGAEDAFVVNNGAAAILLTLAALARGREVILSRGEMVEIGGSFRMPDVLAESGCRLVEVGCTNKTRLADYKAAIREETGAILRCHPSNFRIVGFTEAPSDRDLAELAHAHGLPFLFDQGNGGLVDLTAYGLPAEETLQEVLQAGAEVATASGDKLLGGPQAGLILGRADAVALIRRHPLARALRVDKLTLAALEATLQLHLEHRRNEIPTFRALGRPLAELKRDAQRLARAYLGRSVVELGESEVGGGSVPGVGLPTWRAGLESPDPQALARRLRQADPPLLGRIERGMNWLDPRTLDPAEVRLACQILRSCGELE